LVGSVRPQSNTAKAAAVAVDELCLVPGAAVDIVDPRLLDLRLPGAPGTDTLVTEAATSLQQRVQPADGILMVTPEYDGSYSAVMKLLIEYLGYPSVLAGKPIALLGVASGSIGAARALDHLRGVCLHIGAVVVPGSRSVATVHKGFDAAGRAVDAAKEADIRAVAQSLVSFLTRLAPPRST
jgi:NAD(P)H-dependent FMN reductase